MVAQGRVTNKIHGDPLGVREQQHITQTGNLTVECLHTEACCVQEVFQLLLVFPKTLLRQDVCLPHRCRVELVLPHAALPRFEDDRVPRSVLKRILLLNHAKDFLHMPAIIEFHGLPSDSCLF